MTGVSALVTYSLLSLLWGAILALYVRQLRVARKSDPLIAMLLGVLTLDAAKTVIESGYFGLYWGAAYGLLPKALLVLREPHWLTPVKWFNVLVGLVVLGWLIRRWIPAELRERQQKRDAQLFLQGQLEQSLREAKENEQRFFLAAEATEAAVWDWDLRTDTCWYSARFATMLGMPVEQWRRELRPWSSSLHPDDKAATLEQMRRFIDGAIPRFEVRTRLMHRDGRALWVSASGVLIRDASGKAVRMVGFTRDITAELEAQQKQAQTQKLESLGLLAGGIAHDFNNLLTVISSSVLVATDLSPARGEAVDALRTASGAIQRASALTRQLLAYAGKARLAKEPVDLGRLVEGITELLRVSLPKGARLSIRVADEVPPVLADPVQLQQVVMNLVMNAAEAIGRSEGAISIEVAVTDLDRVSAERLGALGRAPAGLHVALRVEDTGCGMPPEVQARIFDPFFTTKPTGHGLGLSAMLGIVGNHDGAIRVHSRPGLGTTFTIYLPGRPDLAKGRAPAEPEPMVRSLGARVLVVDDEPLLRKSAARLLRGIGCSVVEASSGAEAIAVVESGGEPVDVVLMDITMPEVNGYEARSRLQQLAPGLPVVLSSGLGDAALEQHAPKHTFFLGKPYDVKQLDRVLRQALQSRLVA